jgi:predicted metal-dependent enzyme (double-stranded beta helix superfamily)
MNPAPGLQQTAPITTAFPAPDSAGADGRGEDRMLSPAQLGRLVRATAGARAAWLPAVRFSSDGRWFHRLEVTADYEIWLLTWLPGQHTGFHDHCDASGAFAVARGELRETLASAGRSQVRHRAAREGSVTRFGGRHLHDVGNVGPAAAVSVHAYSPPLSAMRRYEMTSSGLALVRTDRAELDW